MWCVCFSRVAVAAAAVVAAVGKDADTGNDADAGTLTLYGKGAHIGLGKVINDAEIGNIADAPDSITYIVSELSHTAMTLHINNGDGFWRFKLVCADDSCVGGDSDPADSGTGTGGEVGGLAQFTGVFGGFIANAETIHAVRTCIPYPQYMPTRRQY